MENVASIVGAISGSLSLLGLVYLFGVWRGKVDSALNEFKQCLKDYPPAEMWTMTKTLWEIYVIDALHHRPDLAEHGSSFKLKKAGEEIIPDDIKQLLRQIPLNPYNHEAIATGCLVVQHIGLDRISKMSEEKGLSIQEAIALLSTYLDNEATT
ncbi:hypothetical protein ES703_60158 [subsurface metagenome]